MPTEIVILGCGSSGGVPRVGQGWGACDPDEPKNRRRRCAILVSQGAPGADEAGRTRVLVDMGPDLREQLLDADVKRLDGILLTHPHADHLHGIDDVRPLTMIGCQRIPVYMDAPTSAEAHAKFGYIFETPVGSNYPPLLDERRIEHGEPGFVDGPGGRLDFTPVQVGHGDIVALGFRFGRAAYLPDVKIIPEAHKALFAGLDLWILDALRYTRHPSHFCLDEALAAIEELKPRRAVLTNLHTDLDYAELAARLPAHVQPAYDGMKLAMED